MCCRRIIFGTLIILTIGVFVAQIAFGVHYLHKPVACDRVNYLTILILAGGCSGVASIVSLVCYCYNCGFSLLSSKNDQSSA
jgi:hypothetical protein